LKIKNVFGSAYISPTTSFNGIKSIEAKNMSKKLVGLVISFVILWTIYLVYPMLKSDAQISQDQKEKQEAALQVVKGQPLSNSFYEKLVKEEKLQNVSWTLTKAFHGIQSHKAGTLRVAFYEESFLMFFEQNKVEVRVGIDRFETDELAIKTFNSFSNSQGRVENLKEYGDEGRKVISGNGKFANLSFRKGKFEVRIGCDSEEIARRFADYTLKTLEGY